MPTRKPRIAVTLDPHVYETISRLAALEGVSRSAVVADLLASVHAPLMRTVALLDAAREAPREVREGLRRAIEGMELQMVAAAGASVGQMDWLLSQLRGDSPRDSNHGGQVSPSDRPRRGS